MTLNPHEELLERARKVIQDLRQKLTAAEARTQSSPVAVIGLGMRFPGCGSDPERFWRMIVEGRDAVEPVPADRWDRDAFYSPDAATPGKINTRYGSFLEDVRRFDAAFFDITPREAIRMDPQQRIFLETAWHALEDAGLPKACIAGTDAGIFVGVHSHSTDYQAMQFGDPATLDAYAGPGTAQDMVGGRLAYWLDLHGPAVTVNTACSSSLTAVHLACRSLRAGDCGVAFAGGVNLFLRPAFTIAAAQLQVLSADGRCKAFDARADGMGRGEGCGVVVLKMLDAALRDGDRVLAIIRGSAVNQDGKTNGLTAPNGLAQQRVLRRALQDAGVQPWEIGYIEAHGTGTALGDPIEVEALAEVLAGEQRATPCTLGAVKANVGHLEGAAGIAGLIKTILVLRHRWLPPVANLEKLNPHLALHGNDLSIPQKGREWITGGRRFAGVSSFGWSGTNVHVVLEEAPASRAAAAEPGIRPVLVSAQSPEALRILAAAFARRLESADASELADISYTSSVRRTHHAFRIAVTGSDAKEMAVQLRRRLEDSAGAGPPDRITASEPSRLTELILAWEAGGAVDWAIALPPQGSLVDLPQYPFQGRPYWLDTSRGTGVDGSSLVSDLVTPRKEAVDVQEKSLLEGLADLSQQERRNRLLDFVGDAAREIFGMPPTDPLDETSGLFQLGMDSLMSVMLRHRLAESTGLDLPETLTLTYPTITALAEYLEEKLFASADAPSGSVQPLSTREPDPSLSASVTGMTDIETGAAIAAELAAIQQKIGVL